MTPEQITVLAATGESETLEFKHTDLPPQPSPLSMLGSRAHFR